MRAADFDHHDPQLTAANVWARYAELAADGPVAWSEAHGGFWAVTGFAEARQAARDHQTFSSAAGHLIPMTGAARSIPIDYDPPLHADYRAATMAALSRDRVHALQEPIRDFLAEALGELASRGGGEAISAIALPLPLLVLTELLGLSEAAVAALRPMTERMWERVGSEDLATARAEILDLMEAEISRQLESGTGGPIEALAATEVESRPLQREELRRLLATLAIAGHETTMHAVGNLLFDLAAAPETQRALRADPTLIPSTVEESLRLRAPAHSFARTVTADTKLGGAHLRTGDKALLIFAAANRDPNRYPSPTTLLPDRAKRGHLAFGAGIHHCAGAFLARTELRILLELLIEEPEFRLAGEPTFSGLEGGHHMGPRTLPLAFGAAAD